MPSLIIITRSGESLTVVATLGLSVMENIRNADVDELIALCGGCRSCATCHVYIESLADVLPAMSTSESDLLDSLEYRTPESRLSCQIPFTDTMDGLRVTIAPEE